MSTKTLDENVHGSFLYNSPKLETAQMSINRRMNRQTMVYYSSRKINKLLIHATTSMNLKNIMPEPKSIYYDPIYL